MSAPRIGIFVQDLKGGGAERMMANLVGAWAAIGQPLDLVVVRRTGPYWSQVPSTVRVVELKTRRVVYSVPALARYLRRERPAALLTTLAHVNVAALLARALARVPTRVVIREAVHTSMINKTNTPQFGVRAACRVAPRVYRWADAVVAVSHGVAEDLIHRMGVPPGRVHVIRNPVVTPHLRAQMREPADHAWLVRKEMPVVLGVGRLVHAKGFDTLLRAFAGVRRQRPARLIILGQGPLRADLLDQVRQLGLGDCTALPGFAGNPYAWMARADAFVLPSRWEGSPNVLVEAMACGAPVVATDCPSGPAEILEGGKYGRLVPVDDAERMTAAMLDALDNPIDPARVRERTDAYSAERNAQAYLQCCLGGAADVQPIH